MPYTAHCPVHVICAAVSADVDSPGGAECPKVSCQSMTQLDSASMLFSRSTMQPPVGTHLIASCQSHCATFSSCTVTGKHCVGYCTDQSRCQETTMLQHGLHCLNSLSLSILIDVLSQDHDDQFACQGLQTQFTSDIYTILALD